MDYFEYCGSKIMMRDGPIVTSYNWEETEKQSRTNKIRMIIFTDFFVTSTLFFYRFITLVMFQGMLGVLLGVNIG